MKQSHLELITKIKEIKISSYLLLLPPPLLLILFKEFLMGEICFPLKLPFSSGAGFKNSFSGTCLLWSLFGSANDLLQGSSWKGECHSLAN